jgi:hypothetical protein
MSEQTMNEKTWSDRMAGLAVDALLTAKIIQKSDFDWAVEIVSEELSVRLSLGDNPPVEQQSPTKDV